MAYHRRISGRVQDREVLPFVAGGTIVAGTWVKGSGSDGTVTAFVDNDTSITGLAVTSATSGGNLEVEIPLPGDIYQGSTDGDDFAATDYFAKFGPDASGNVDVSNTTAGEAAFIVIPPINGETLAGLNTKQEIQYSINTALLTAPGGSLAV